jgi:hypothetical protein
MDETNALLRELLAEIRGLRADLAGRPTAPKAASLQELIDAIAFAVGDKAFTAKELVTHAEALPAERLKNALNAAGGTNHKCIGRLLLRMSKQEFSGWRIKRLFRERDGLLWIIEPVTLRV